MGVGFSIEELSDQREIEVLVHRYATGIDTGDHALVGTIFAPGGTIDYRSIGGPAGRWEPDVREWSEQSLAAFPVRQHSITNTEVRVAPDRSSAASVSYWRSVMGFAKPDGTTHLFESGGRYVDDLVRTEDGWRIQHRHTAQDWMLGTLPDELVIPE